MSEKRWIYWRDGPLAIDQQWDRARKTMTLSVRLLSEGSERTIRSALDEFDRWMERREIAAQRFKWGAVALSALALIWGDLALQAMTGVSMREGDPIMGLDRRLCARALVLAILWIGGALALGDPDDKKSKARRALMQWKCENQSAIEADDERVELRRISPTEPSALIQPKKPCGGRKEPRGRL